jgi:hypothetical protein
MKTIKAFHGDPEIKAKYLARVRAHRAADELIHGTYWVDGKGCAVGCTVHSSSHVAYETELGIPIILARLEDGIFEGLPNEDSMMWPEAFLDAIPVGADLSMVWPKFALWLLGDPADGVVRFATDDTRPAIELVIGLYRDWVKSGVHPSVEACRAARSAAWSAHAAAHAAADAAWSATRSAAAADTAAAYAAADAIARKRQAAKLLELLRNA